MVSRTGMCSANDLGFRGLCCPFFGNFFQVRSGEFGSESLRLFVLLLKIF